LHLPLGKITHLEDKGEKKLNYPPWLLIENSSKWVQNKFQQHFQRIWYSQIVPEKITHNTWFPHFLVKLQILCIPTVKSTNRQGLRSYAFHIIPSVVIGSFIYVATIHIRTSIIDKQTAHKYFYADKTKHSNMDIKA